MVRKLLFGEAIPTDSAPGRSRSQEKLTPVVAVGASYLISRAGDRDRSEEHEVLQKAELSAQADSENNLGGS
jgi:hypothetical protein